MGFLKQHILTKITGFIILLTVVFTIVSQEKWNDESAIINSDVRGYYAYLPALFIHHDLTFKHPEVYQKNGVSQVWVLEGQDGIRYIKYTCGMALLYSPFFYVGHLIASYTDYPADGFSPPYKIALIVSALFYLIIALYFLSAFLLRYFQDNVVSITLLILFIGSNAFHYYTGSLTYSHGYSLALIAVFFYSFVRWKDAPQLKWAILIGISSGLMVLIRPIDVLFLLFPVLFQVGSLDALKSRISMLWKERIHILIMGFVFVLMLLPQLLYFKLISGHFIYYSYSGEGFFFSHPHLLDTLISYRNGWLVYSPLMLFSLLGFYALYKQHRNMLLSVGVIFFLYFFVLSSWWCWWYVGFGNRAFINLYPLLSLPLAALSQSLLANGKVKRLLFQLFVLAGLILSVFQNYQFNTNAIHWDGMTKAAYWDSFGREKPSQLFETYVDFPDNDLSLQGKNAVHTSHTDTLEVRYNHFNTTAIDSIYLPYLTWEDAKHTNGMLGFPRNSVYNVTQSIALDKKASHVYITAWVKNAEDVFVVLSGEDTAPYYAASSEVVSSNNGWNKIHLNAALPSNYPADSLQFYIWNQQGAPFLLDDLRFEFLKRTRVLQEEK